MIKALKTLKCIILEKMQPTFYRAKIRRFCKKALFDFDGRIEQYIDFENGFFVEAGANNGIKQSNTYYLEAIKGWRGILIEPVPHLYQQCCINRPKSICVNCALVSHSYDAETVELDYADLMTMVSSESGNENFDANHIASGRDNQSISDTAPKKIISKAETLDKILQQFDIHKIDLLSLDMEGYEAEALKGLSLNKFAPQWLLIEVRDLTTILSILGDKYSIASVLSENDSYKDILFKKNELCE
jgi:FkbM family methyltransferase